MSGIRVDGHVHLHHGFDLGRVADAVLRRAAGGEGPLVLLLAEGPDERVLPRLRAASGVRVADTAEPGSIRLLGGPGAGAGTHRPGRDDAAGGAEGGNGAAVVDGAAVVVVHGRQIISSDGLEVLALGLPPGDPLGRIPDRVRPTGDLVSGVLDTGAVAALPWGVGKWLGRRGRVVDAIVAGPVADHPRFVLGDIFHRTWPWPEPAPFRAGPRVLRGTDPLRIAGLEARPGAYGSVVEGTLDPDRPWASIRDAIAAGGIGPAFGRPASPLLAFAEQLRYRHRPLPAPTPGSAPESGSTSARPAPAGGDDAREQGGDR